MDKADLEWLRTIEEVIRVVGQEVFDVREVVLLGQVDGSVPLQRDDTGNVQQSAHQVTDFG